MSVPMRAKMYILSITQWPDAENPTQEDLYLYAVAKSEPYDETGSDENNTFARWTPMAEMKISIQNPALIGKYKAGDHFYLDFTPTEK